MAGIAGSHADSLAPIIPGADLAAAVTPQIAPMRPSPLADAPPTPLADPSANLPAQSVQATPGINQAPQATPDPLDAILDQHLGPQGQDPLDAILDQHLGPSDSSVKAEADANPDHADALQRMQIGMEANDADKLEHLKKIYGPDGAKEVDGKLLVKKDGKWANFNNNSFGLGMGDAANLGREVVTQAPVYGAEAVGTGLAGAEASTGAGAAAIPVTLAASRAIGGAVGELTARKINTMLGGVNHTLSDDMAAAAEQGGMQALFGHLVGKVGESFGKSGIELVGNKVQPIVDDAVSKVVTPMAEQATKSAETSAAKFQPYDAENKLSRAVQDATDLNAKATKLGIQMTPSELFPGNQKMQDLMARANTSPAMDEFREGRAIQVDNLVTQFGNTVAKGDPTILPDIVAKASVLDHSLGAEIGNDRAQAIIKHGDQLVNANGSSEFAGNSNFNDGLTKAARRLGFADPDSGALDFSYRTRPSSSDIAQSMGMDESKVNWLSKAVVDWNDKLTNGNGQLTLKETNKIYDQLSQQLNNAYDGQNNIRPQYSKDYVGALLDLKNGIRDTLTEGIGTTMGKEGQDAYKQRLATFSTNKNALEDMSNLLKRADPKNPDSNPTAQYVMNYITKSPADAPARIQAFKTIFGDTHPEAIDSLKAAHWQQVLNQSSYSATDIATTQKVGSFKAEPFLNSMKDGTAKREIMESLYGAENTKSLIDMAKVIGVIQRDYKPGQVDASSFVKRAFISGYSFIKGNPDEAIALFNANSAAKNAINGATTSKLLQGLSPEKQTIMNKIIAGVKAPTLKQAATGLAAQNAVSTMNNNSPTGN